MKRIFKLSALIGFVILLSAFSAHKFYVAIYQINFAENKKMLQVTSRIFVDDINEALYKRYSVRTHLGDKAESDADVALLKKYLAENFTLKVNGKPRPMQYLSKEMENNVLICYFNSKDISKVSSIEVSNKILIDYVTDQQNIIQTTVNGKKGSLLLTADQTSGKLNF